MREIPDDVPDSAERQRRREEYAERAARDAGFQRRYHRRLRRERRANPSKHVLLIGSPPADDLETAIAGRPEIGARWTRTLPDGTVQRGASVLDYNP